MPSPRRKTEERETPGMKARRLPRLARGMVRQFIRCRECGRPYFYDYQPFSLGNPLLATPCGHSIGAPSGDRLNAYRITPSEFYRLRTREIKSALSAERRRARR